MELLGLAYNEAEAVHRASEWIFGDATAVLLTSGWTITLIALLRYGPEAALQLLAGFVAILTRDPKRARRALKVMRLARKSLDHDAQARTGASRANRLPSDSSSGHK